MMTATCSPVPGGDAEGEVLCSMKFSRKKKEPRLAVARHLNECFHVVEVTLQGPAAGRRQAVFGPRHPPREALGTGDIPRLLQLAGVDAQIAVGRVHQLLQLVEAEGGIHRQRAHDAKPEPLMNEAIERRRYARGPATSPASPGPLVVRAAPPFLRNR